MPERRIASERSAEMYPSILAEPPALEAGGGNSEEPDPDLFEGDTHTGTVMDTFEHTLRQRILNALATPPTRLGLAGRLMQGLCACAEPAALLHTCAGRDWRGTRAV
jgi:hypothetical protein